MGNDSVKKIPHFPKVGIIALVPDDWGGPWMPREHVLTRLASYFHVVWVEPARGWRVLFRARIKRFKMPFSKQMPVEGFSIYTPRHWMRKFYWPKWLANFMSRRRLRGAKKILEKKGCNKFILYIWRPEFIEALDNVRYDFSCYHIDDEYTFSDFDSPVNDMEAQLIKRVDQVIVHSHGLMQKKGNINPCTVYITNGVDYEAYSRLCDEPPDLTSIPHPRIGYVGIIKKQLNFELLLGLAKRHADYSFVFVGPLGYLGDKARLVDELKDLRNTYFLGAKTIEELPAYTQHMDVCMLCYVVNDYTKYIYPLKLHEYLATGNPVVGASIHSLLEFRHIVRLADTLDEWSEALTYSLSDEATSDENFALRQQVAQQYDWNLLVRNIAHLFCEKLGSGYLEEFKNISN